MVQDRLPERRDRNVDRAAADRRKHLQRQAQGREPGLGNSAQKRQELALCQASSGRLQQQEKPPGKERPLPVVVPVHPAEHFFKEVREVRAGKISREQVRQILVAPGLPDLIEQGDEVKGIFRPLRVTEHGQLSAGQPL